MSKQTSRIWRQAAALAASLTLVVACGGGGDDAATGGTPGAGATSYTQGPITGFGSIIVNGVRWDDSGAQVLDDDGGRHGRDRLKLGMVVEIDGSALDRGRGTGRALAVHFGAEMKGPIGSVDATAQTFTLFGQTVEVTTSTVFDDNLPGGFADLAPDAVVEVYGLYDAANARLVATRIEAEPDADQYRLRGIVSALDPNAQTFMIGSELIDYSNAIGVPAALADGVQVKVRLRTAQVDGAWVADRVRFVFRALGDRHDAEVEGVITAWTSATQFEINGLAVDASNARFPDGTEAIVLGAKVEVEGAVVDGVLVASKVELEDERHRGPRQFEIHGRISGLDTTARTFALRGLTVSYAGEVEFRKGTEADLADEARVEVKGRLSADLRTIEATRISFED